MLKKTEKKTEKINDIPKMEGTVSKEIEKSAAVDLAIDVVCPPLGAARHFKRKWKAAKTVKKIEQSIDTILKRFSPEDLAKMAEGIMTGYSTGVESEKTEEETKEEEKEEA